MIVLNFKQGPHQGHRLQFNKQRIVVGRAPECTVCLDDERISWNHCAIEPTDDGWQVVDLGSSNGTKVGPHKNRVDGSHQLRDGESVWIGKTEIEVRFLGDERDRDTAYDPRGPRHTVMDPPLTAPPTGQSAEQRAVERKPQPAAPIQPPQGPGLSHSTINLHQDVAAEILAEDRRVHQERVDAGSAHAQVLPWEGVSDAEPIILERMELTEDDAEGDEFPDWFRLRAKLLFLTGPHRDRVVYLGTGGVTIGRAEDNMVVLTDGATSSYHAMVVKDGEDYFLEDLGSANGTMINGAKAAGRQQLRHRTLMTIGTNIIEFRAPNIDERTEDPLKTTAMPVPLFAFQNKVLTQYGITVGYDPSCDLFLDDASVDRRHARIQWKGETFLLEDQSENGTYVGGKRIVQKELEHGDVAHMGNFGLAFEIEGLRCSISVTLFRKEQAVESFVPGGSDPAELPYRTMYRMLSPDELALLQSDDKPSDVATITKKEETKKKRSLKDLIWVPPGDVRKSWRTHLGAMVGMSGMVLVGLYFAWSGGTAFLNEPLSEAHDNRAFAKMATASLDKRADCTNCHLPFQGASAQTCTSCHTDLPRRSAHAAAIEKGEEDFGCFTCHTEHQTQQELAAFTGEACARCHDDRHAALKDPPPGPVTLAPPPLTTTAEGHPVSLRAGVSTEEIHKIHQGIERRCSGCHANQDLSGPVDASTSCFRCHGDVAQLSSLNCATCHGAEHGLEENWVAGVLADAGVELEEGDRQARIFGPVSAPRTVGTGAFAILVLFVPIGFVFTCHKIWTTIRDRPRPKKTTGGGDEPPPTPWEIRINLDKCVGTASCVNVCPYDVLAMDGHKAVIKNFDACKKCRDCERVCGPKALRIVDVGEPPPMVDLPDLDPYYQSSVPGLYIVGQVTNVKPGMLNANNLGRMVIEHMIAEGCQPGAHAARGMDLDVVVVGSGPGGLSAGACAAERGLNYVVFEKHHECSRTFRNMPKGKHLQREPPGVEAVGPLPMFDEADKDFILEQWEQWIAEKGLKIQYKEEVLEVKPREGGGFDLKTNKASYSCAAIVMAVGTDGNPRRPNVPGEDLDKVHYALVDPDVYDDQDIVVLGGGNSALEDVFALSSANGGSNRVALSYRKDEFGRVSDRNREHIMELAEKGTIKLLLQTSPVEIKDDVIVLKNNEDDSLMELPNDHVFVRFGAVPPTKWLQKIGVKYTQKPEDWDPGPTDDLSALELAARLAS